MSLAQNERHQSVVNEAVRQTPGTVNMWNGLRNLLDYVPACSLWKIQSLL